MSANILANKSNVVTEWNPFLEALDNIEYGNLSIITPENQVMEFFGKEAGIDAKMTIHDWRVFDDLVSRGQIGFADAYIDGYFETDDLPALLSFMLHNATAFEHFLYGNPWHAIKVKLVSALNSNSLKGSRRNIMKHYDLGNDFYSLWLDKSMTYSCALFEDDKNRTLEEAQKAKYQRILKKLDAKPGDNILEIGCGWGGFAEIAAQNGVNVTALTISPEQADYAKERLSRQNLSGQASITLTDYREVSKQYDHIVSIGMFEHVGENYWPVYFQTIQRCLKPEGKAIIQTITLDDLLFNKLHNQIGFLEYYIFPGGKLPSKSRFREEALKAGLECREMFAFGYDYARTLSHWLERFESQEENVRKLGFDSQFMRLWKFYLAGCIACFTSERTDVMQAELHKYKF